MLLYSRLTGSRDYAAYIQAMAEILGLFVSSSLFFRYQQYYLSLYYINIIYIGLTVM